MNSTSLRADLAARFDAQTTAFAVAEPVQALLTGRSDRATYDAFIANLCIAHLKSPQILAFLYSAAPPAAVAVLQHNLLEELGLDGEERSHPELLQELAIAAGFTPEQRAALERDATRQLHQFCTEPLLLGTLKELVLVVLYEVASFEWLLARQAGALGRALQAHRGLPVESLTWFFHHAEVDARHAEETLDALVAYIEHYDFFPSELALLLDLASREHPVLKRYFPAIAPASEPTARLGQCQVL